MDFSSLARRELQALCKKNKLPANLTNVAMADSLRALQHVEGLEEFLNQSNSDPHQSPEKTMKGSLNISRTTGRTSTRSKPIKEEQESSQPMTQSRRGMRRAVSDEMDDEKTEVPKTPAAPSTRRRAPAASARQKTQTQKEKPSVQSVYNTRRSVRLLEKNMSKLSLDYGNNMPFKMDELSTEINNGSEKSDVSGSVDKGSYMQTGSEAGSETIDASEVSSEPKSSESLEKEGQLKDDVHDNNKTDVIEVADDSNPKSKMESEVSESKSISDGHADSKSPTLGETEEVEEVANIEEAAKPDTLTRSLSGEQKNVLSSKDPDMYGSAEDDYNEKFDFESDSPTEEDSVDGSSFEIEAMDDIASECQDKESDDMKAGEGNLSFEADSSTDEDSEDSADDNSEEESSENEIESMDDIASECQHKESDDMKAGEGNLSFEADSITDEDSEVSDVDNSEEESSANEPSCVKQMSPNHPFAAHEESPHSESLVAKMTHDGPPSLDKSETPTLPPLEADVSHQFPRPSLSTPRKSSGSEIMSYISDENEENIDDSSDKTLDLELGGGEVKKGEAAAKKDITQKSLRELKKMLKDQLNNEDKNGGKMMVEKPRSALQQVPENQMAVAVNKPNGN